MKIKTVIRISELKLPITHTEAELEKEIQKVLRLKKQPFTYECMRQSVDARKKPELFYVYTVDVDGTGCVNRKAPSQPEDHTGRKEGIFLSI